MLFGFPGTESETIELTGNVVEEESAHSAVSNIDITSLLENKKMSKIIDVIFDYDMEEFANTIERIGEAPDIESAVRIIDKICKASQCFN